MRTLYFELDWLKREARAPTASTRNSWCGCRRSCTRQFWHCLMITQRPEANGLLLRLTMLELDRAELADLHPAAARPRCRRAAGHAPRSNRRARNRNAGARSAPRRGRCRGCFPRDAKLSFRAGIGAPASPPRSRSSRRTPMSRLSNWLPIWAYASVPAFSTPSGRSPARHRPSSRKRREGHRTTVISLESG